MDTFTPANLPHRLLSTFIYRHLMMWRECRARRLMKKEHAGATCHEKY